jgi:hypothetical protein
MPRESACACAAGFFDGYVPVVPICESRTPFTALVMPTTPFTGTQGDGDTPCGGSIGFNLQRVDDERRFTDDQFTQFEVDGELQIATLEWVSARQTTRIGCSCIPWHVAIQVSAYSQHSAWYDGLRNFFEENIIGRDQGIADAHGLGGVELSATTAAGDRIDFADSSPMWKAKGILKVALPDFDVKGRPGHWSASLGVTAPAFGSNRESGNTYVVPEVVLAATVPVAERFRLTGAASLTVPGPSENFDDLGIDHNPVVWGAYANLEWWASPRFAVAAGLSANGPYTVDSGLPTDLFSFYVNVGVLYRVTDRVEVHLLFSENPGTGIITNGDANSNYNLNTQRDADFTITFGGTLDF